MCAMIPMFRTRSRAVAVCVRVFSATLVTSSFALRLPPIVGKGLVGLSHPIQIVLTLERASLLVERVQNLARELVRHRLLAPVAREGHEPADGERPRPALRHL